MELEDWESQTASELRLHLERVLWRRQQPRQHEVDQRDGVFRLAETYLRDRHPTWGLCGILFEPQETTEPL
jgi:hypothetical protein